MSFVAPVFVLNYVSPDSYRDPVAYTGIKDGEIEWTTIFPSGSRIGFSYCNSNQL